MQKIPSAEHADIVGCEYQISVLRDNFVERVLDALGKVKTDKIWAETGKTSTIYRGKAAHVVDCVKACFSHIYDDSLPYITMTATFFKNSSDDFSKDCFIAEDDVPLNNVKKQFNVLGRMSLFPLGVENLEKHTAAMVDFAHNRNIHVAQGHYANNFEGNVHDMFDLINDILAYGNRNVRNYALNMSLTIYGAEAVK